MKEITSTDPMRFTRVAEQDATHHAATRASAPLTTGFRVATYKAYATSAQQTVMPQYEVEYKTSGSAWDGTVRPYWEYENVNGQHLCFWDYSNFPYRFHAIAPCPPKGQYNLNDKDLRIYGAYYAQKCHNGMITCIKDGVAASAAEPYMIAQVQRNADGKDYDLLSREDNKEINTTSASRNRDVELPFHHLNSKVRFGIYSSAQWTTANRLYIKDLEINVTSAHYAYEANGYQAKLTYQNIPDAFSAQGAQYNWRNETGNSGFTNVQTIAAPQTIFRFDGGGDITGNDLRESQTPATAFWLQCQQGIMQIPQENVQMTVSFDLYDDSDRLYRRVENYPVRIVIDDTDPDNIQYDYTFDWISGYLHTYYINLTDVEKLEIIFTATLTPWEDVTGSLSTDLEK